MVRYINQVNHNNRLLFISIDCKIKILVGYLFVLMGGDKHVWCWKKGMHDRQPNFLMNLSCWGPGGVLVTMLSFCGALRHLSPVRPCNHPHRYYGRYLGSVLVVSIKSCLFVFCLPREPLFLPLAGIAGKTKKCVEMFGPLCHSAIAAHTAVEGGIASKLFTVNNLNMN